LEINARENPMNQQSFLIISKEILADKRISVTAKLLLAQLIDHRNKNTGQCNPKWQTLAAELDISQRTIARAMQELKQAGWIAWKRTRLSSKYEIKICQNGTSRHAKMAGEKCQNGMSGPPVSLYEPDQRTIPKEPARAPCKLEGIKENRKAVGALTGALSIRNPEPSSETQYIAAMLPDLFPIFWECFVRAGIPLNGRDESQARRLFAAESRDVQEQIGAWVIRQLQGPWRSPEFTPNPVNALRSRGWERAAAPRSVPRKPSSIERGIQMYYQSQKEKNLK
jgi:DNA-binding transcriptional regulator YhcF (GntR family)